MKEFFNSFIRRDKNIINEIGPIDLPNSDIFVGIKIFKINKLSLPYEDIISEKSFIKISPLLNKFVRRGYAKLLVIIYLLKINENKTMHAVVISLLNNKNFKSL